MVSVVRRVLTRDITSKRIIGVFTVSVITMLSFSDRLRFIFGIIGEVLFMEASNEAVVSSFGAKIDKPRKRLTPAVADVKGMEAVVMVNEDLKAVGLVVTRTSVEKETSKAI